MKRLSIAILVTVLVAVQGFAASPDGLLEAVTKNLRATLQPDNAEFKSSTEAKLKCSVKNTSAGAVQIDTAVLDVAILSLAVLDSQGKVIPTVPPPMPRPAAEREKYLKTLDPGQEYEITYSLNMFSPSLKPGTYSARLKRIESNTVKFKIVE